MKKEITITIPDRLTSEQEILAIKKQLTTKMLSSSARDSSRKRIGDSVDIEYLETTITVKRKGPKPIELLKCNVCGCEYQSDEFKAVFVNYGGPKRSIKVCCEECQDTLIDMCGQGRASKRRNGLKATMIR